MLAKGMEIYYLKHILYTNNASMKYLVPIIDYKSFNQGMHIFIQRIWKTISNKVIFFYLYSIAVL